MKYSLEELFELAQQYGNIDLFQNVTDRTFSVNITFQTIKHAELKAMSGFGNKTIEGAICAAIKQAEIIVAQFKTESQKEYKLLENSN